VAPQEVSARPVDERRVEHAAIRDVQRGGAARAEPAHVDETALTSGLDLRSHAVYRDRTLTRSTRGATADLDPTAEVRDREDVCAIHGEGSGSARPHVHGSPDRGTSWPECWVDVSGRGDRRLGRGSWKHGGRDDEHPTEGVSKTLTDRDENTSRWICGPH